MAVASFTAMIVENGKIKLPDQIKRGQKDLPPGEILKVHRPQLQGCTSHRQPAFPKTIPIRRASMPQVKLSSPVTARSNQDKVIVTSYDLGMNTPEGWSYISVPVAWPFRCPRDSASVRA
jgi:hypothetical protein